MRLLPNPLFSLVLWAVWLALNHSVSPAHLLLGALLAWVLPIFAGRASGGAWPRVRKPVAALRLTMVVLHDVVTANIEVARRVLGPEAAIKPGFLRVPLDLVDEWAITCLACIITMTPGTLTADVAEDRSSLLVHAFHLEDRDALIASIKARYEAPLREIFG